jgi:glycosyltransferase involved in cell wall biosynthesis
MRASAISLLRVVARKALPERARHWLVRSYIRLETTFKTSLERRFRARPIPLERVTPVFNSAAFAGGPIVMVNNALASGGVERQIVNTLRDLGERSGRRSGLLCLRLGGSDDLDFFRPALEQFPGFVRNAMSAIDARRTLAASLSRLDYKRVKSMIRWMPSDIRGEILRFVAEFSKLKPLVVHAWQDSVGISATYAAKIVGVPRILISTRNVRPTNFAWYRPYMKLAYYEIARCDDITMINNSFAGAADYSDWLELPVGRFVVKRNGLDTSTMKRAPDAAVASLRAQLHIPQGSAVVGSIFRFHDEKRPFLWVKTAWEVARRQPETHFVVFGDGPLLQQAVAMARELGIGHQFHAPGKIENAALGLSLFDAFLLTSEFEGTPNVILEASALGVPIVATEAGGIGEAIEQGVTGFLVETIEPADIADRIVDILSNASRRSKLEKAGPTFVDRRFGLSRMISETLQLYKMPPV